MRSSRGPATPPTRVAAPDSPRRPAATSSTPCSTTCGRTSSRSSTRRSRRAATLVYLHASEFARLEGIVPVLQEQTTRALAEELEKLNRRSRLRRWADRWRGGRDPEIRNAAADWQVEFLPDPDGDVAEGDILIDSELLLPASPELGVGERTRRITTVHAGAADDHARADA